MWFLKNFYHQLNATVYSCLGAVSIVYSTLERKMIDSFLYRHTLYEDGNYINYHSAVRPAGPGVRKAIQSAVAVV